MTTPVLVFMLYFGVVFAIGWYSMRATRDESDYWIAGGQLGWLVGGATLAATHTSAGTFIGVMGVMYTAGWSFGWIVLTIPFGYWFMAAVLAPRFTRVRELSLPAFIESRYGGKRIRALAAVIILVATVVYIQAQIVAGGIIANIVFGVPTRWGMIGFTAILLAYTVVGGMIAVVYTDLFQLVIMATAVAFALPMAVHQVGGVHAVFAHAQEVNPLTFTWHGLPPALLLTMSVAFLLGSVSTPEKLTRLYAMKDMRTIRRGILFAMVVVTSINLTIFLLSLTAVVLFPALPSGDVAMPMVARTVLPTLLGSVLLAAITAAMMSTVDSLLLVAGSALAYDIYQSIINPAVTPRRRVWIDRAGIVLVGSVPVLLLLSGVGEGELVQFIVLLFIALMASSFFMPVVLGVLWRRANRQGAMASMIGGITAAFLWKAFGIPVIDPVIPGFLTSAALMVGVSLLTPPPDAELLAPYFPGASRQDAGPPSDARRVTVE